MPENYTNLFLQKNVSAADFILETIKRWYIVVGIIAASLIITAVYTIGFVTPTYTSTAKLYIRNKQSDVITSADFSISTYLSNDFAQIIVDTPILSQVSKELNNKYSVGRLRGIVSVSKPENTRIIEITAESPDPKDSKKIVDSICKISEVKLVEIMGLDRIEVIKEGDIPSNPSSPNLSNNMSFAFIIALVIGEIAIALNYIFNNKISSTGDIEKFLGLNVLATIPYNQTKAKNK